MLVLLSATCSCDGKIHTVRERGEEERGGRGRGEGREEGTEAREGRESI